MRGWLGMGYRIGSLLGTCALVSMLSVAATAAPRKGADGKDGKRLWQLRTKGPYSATPVGAGNLLYCVNEKGLLQVVDIAAPEGAVVSELDLGKTILSTPSIANGAVYVRSDAKVWKLKKA